MHLCYDFHSALYVSASRYSDSYRDTVIKFIWDRVNDKLKMKLRNKSSQNTGEMNRRAQGLFLMASTENELSRNKDSSKLLVLHGIFM